MRKLFGTDGIRGIANEYPLTVEMCDKLAAAICSPQSSILQKNNPTILIGKDTRISGDMLEHAMAAALASRGADVELLGVVPTPAVSLLTKKLNADLGIVISASHNPFQYNGIKLFNKDGLKLKDEEEQKLENIIFANSEKESVKKIGRIKNMFGAKKIYIDSILSKFNFDGQGIHVVVDSANGALSSFAAHMIAAFGFRVTSIFDSHDGYNINANCGATHPEVLGELVKSCAADVGVAFDGDGDRMIFCDENGEIMDGNQVLAALCGKDEMEIVSTIISNYGLEKFCKNRSIKLTKTNVGDRYISEYMQRNPVAKIGGEPSGHIILREHLLTGDGLFSCLKILEKFVNSGKNLFSEFSHVFMPSKSVNQNIEIKNKNVIEKTEIKSLIEDSKKLLSGHGKLIVRASGTEPVVRIVVEGDNEPLLKKISDSICNAIREYADD